MDKVIPAIKQFIPVKLLIAIFVIGITLLGVCLHIQPEHHTSILDTWTMVLFKTIFLGQSPQNCSVTVCQCVT